MGPSFAMKGIKGNLKLLLWGWPSRYTARQNSTTSGAIVLSAFVQETH
jgi:hypothetical protein